MRIPVKDLELGLYDNKTVYICDYRREDLNKKCSRHFRPREVTVRDSGSRRVGYGSDKHFTSIEISGPIKVNDNTRHTNPVSIFTTMEECKAHYNDLIQEVVVRWDIWYDGAYSKHRSETENLKEFMV